ncbi:MAG: ABC transporter permease [Lachnospiraceae bacterium]|nr:ABC transporter permease [Lachnospiraceae bacterium]
MFLTLLKKECIQYLKSITYYIFLIALTLDFITQMGTFETVEKPEPGWEDYGRVRTTDKDLIMRNALSDLLDEYDREEYTTYPIGFYKKVILNDEEQEQVKESLLRITGLTEQELDQAYEEIHKEMEELYQQALSGNEAIMVEEDLYANITIRQDLSWQEFAEEMKTLDHLLGGGSKYSESDLEFTWRKKTYEQALEEYESLIKNDRITNAYARLFCDYVGIMLAILPVFLAVTRVLRDRKAQAEQVIFMAGAGSAKIVLSRFLAAVLMTVIPVIVLSCSTMLQSVYYAKSIQAQYDAFAFIRHIGFWLLPMILVSLSVGFFLTELTDSAIAILVQGAWWFVSIFMTGMNLVGAVGWNLVPRFNAVGAFPIYQQMKGQLMKNRLFYVGFSLLLLIFTIIVYNKKRKGEFVSVGTMLRNRKS